MGAPDSATARGMGASGLRVSTTTGWPDRGVSANAARFDAGLASDLLDEAIDQIGDILAAFGEADTFVLDQMAAFYAENGITTADGVKHDHGLG